MRRRHRVHGCCLELFSGSGGCSVAGLMDAYGGCGVRANSLQPAPSLNRPAAARLAACSYSWWSLGCCRPVQPQTDHQRDRSRHARTRRWRIHATPRRCSPRPHDCGGLTSFGASSALPSRAVREPSSSFEHAYAYACGQWVGHTDSHVHVAVLSSSAQISSAYNYN
jgi:hypothetical protein